MTQIYRLHYAPDNASMIVRIALEMLDQPYEPVLVDRKARAQRRPAYLKVNPLGMIPALEHSGGVMFETAAIVLDLSDRHAGNTAGLLPAPTQAARSDALKWLFFLSNSLHAGLRQMFYPDKFIEPGHEEALRRGIAQRIQADFNMVEQLIRDPDCSVLGGETFKALNIYVCVCLRWAQLYPMGPDDAQADWLDTASLPALMELARATELEKAVQIVQIAEGLGETPFSNPTYPVPPEGSAL